MTQSFNIEFSKSNNVALSLHREREKKMKVCIMVSHDRLQLSGEFTNKWLFNYLREANKGKFPMSILDRKGKNRSKEKNSH